METGYEATGITTHTHTTAIGIALFPVSGPLPTFFFAHWFQAGSGDWERGYTIGTHLQEMADAEEDSVTAQ